MQSKMKRPLRAMSKALLGCLAVWLFSGPVIGAKIEADDIIVIDQMVEDKMASDNVYLVLMSGLRKKSTFRLKVVNGLPGPRIEDFRYRDSIIVLPAGKVHLKGDYHSRRVKGAENDSVLEFKGGKFYLLFGKAMKKKWIIDAEAFDLNDEIVKKIKPKSKESWKIAVWEALKKGNSEKSNIFVEPWVKLYQKEIGLAKDAYLSKTAFEKIVGENKVRRKAKSEDK